MDALSNNKKPFVNIGAFLKNLKKIRLREGLGGVVRGGASNLRLVHHED